MATDNDRQYVSAEIEAFQRACDIAHFRSSPYYHKSNGTTGRFYRYLEMTFRAAYVVRKGWDDELSNILLVCRTTYYASRIRKKLRYIFL